MLSLLDQRSLCIVEGVVLEYAYIAALSSFVLINIIIDNSLSSQQGFRGFQAVGDQREKEVILLTHG